MTLKLILTIYWISGLTTYMGTSADHLVSAWAVLLYLSKLSQRKQSKIWLMIRTGSKSLLSTSLLIWVMWRVAPSKLKTNLKKKNTMKELANTWMKALLETKAISKTLLNHQMKKLSNCAILAHILLRKSLPPCPKVFESTTKYLRNMSTSMMLN